MEIWKLCQGQQRILPLKLEAWRVVEDQTTSSTRKLVDSLEEHDILEQEIDQNKPENSLACQGFDYLLFTPFRYPPLTYGSRFGKKTEPSLWYGSADLITALAEKAYYRFVFLFGSSIQDSPDMMSKTAFSALISTNRGIDLTINPFLAYRDLISSPTQWKSSQSLGAAMRENEVHAFSYYSSRAQDLGSRNIGVFSCKGFGKRKPLAKIHFNAFSNRSTVEFLNKGNHDRYIFRVEDFLVEGSFPFPPD